MFVCGVLPTLLGPPTSHTRKPYASLTRYAIATLPNYPHISANKNAY